FYFFHQMKADIAASGRSVVHFIWQRPGIDQAVPKTNIFKLFRPWNYIVATGVYADDVAAETRATALKAAAIAFVLTLVLGGVTTLIARGIARPLAKLRGAMLDLADNRPVEALDVERTDEIGEMARAVAVFRENAAQRAELEDKARGEQTARAERQTRVE